MLRKGKKKQSEEEIVPKKEIPQRSNDLSEYKSLEL